MPPSNARSATQGAGSTTRTSTLWCAYGLAVAVVLSGCAPPRPLLPQDAGVPLADYAELFDAATASCRRVRTLELVLAIDGETGDTRLRGRVRGALARPASLRLEGVAPFGAPAFVLVAGAAPAVLLLPRQRQVVTDASGRQLLEALAGLPLEPDDLRAVLTGCLVPHPQPVAAWTYRNGWTGIETADEAMLYVQGAGAEPLIVAGRRRGLVVAYSEHVRGLPRRVDVTSTPPGGVRSAVTATLSQVNINVEIDARAFARIVPDGFAPTSIDALRPGTGPLAVVEPDGDRGSP